MSAKIENSEECMVPEEDPAGDPNLCCCYAIDEQGGLEDPCTHPVEDCCCY